MSNNHENRRKDHVAQLAKQIHKKDHSSDQTGEDSGLLNQYKVIREDLMKLREDITRGYDIAKDSVSKKTILSELMKLRGNL